MNLRFGGHCNVSPQCMKLLNFSGHYQNGQLFETQKKIPNEMQIILSSSCMVILIFRILAPLVALFWMRDSVKHLEKIVTKKVPLEIEDRTLCFKSRLASHSRKRKSSVDIGKWMASESFPS